MDMITETIRRLREENREFQRQLGLAKGVITRQYDDLAKLEDKVFELEQVLGDFDKLSEQNMKLRKTLGDLRGWEEIFTYANSKLWETNKRQLSLIEYWKSRCEEYRTSFHGCNTQLKAVKKNNDSLRLQLSKYYERYGEIK